MKPTTKLPGSAKAKRRDPFPAWFLLPALVVLLGVVAARRWAIPALLLVAFLGQALSVNWLARNKPAGVYALIATWVVLGASWPWGIRDKPITWAAWVVLGLWAAWKVGRPASPKGAVKHREAVQDLAWPETRDLICAPGTSKVSYDETRDDLGNVVRHVLVIHNPNGNKFNAAEVARSIDNRGRKGKGYPPGSTRFAKGGTEGEWVFTTDLRKPWSVKPTMPTDVNDKGEIPIGRTKWGDIVWLGADIHILVAGETDSGKSTFLELLAYWEEKRNRELRFIDPKRVEFTAWRPVAADYANTFPGALGVLTRLVEEMDRRQAIMEEHGWKKWTQSNARYLGPRITCFIDETSDLFDAIEYETVIDEKGKEKERKIDIGDQCARASIRLARVARAMGINVVFAAQYPTADSVPSAIKQNTPITVCLRVKNQTAVRVALGEDATAEFDTSKPIPQGMAVVDMPGVGRQWVQLFQPPTRTLVAPAPASTRPVALPEPVLPPASAWPPMQGVHGSAEVPTEPERNPAPELDGTTKATIEAMLNGKPITGVDAAEKAKCTPENARKHLRNLAKEGKARKDGRGYVRC